MAEILESPDHEFETSMINMLQTLMEKIDNMQEQMGKASIEMEILRENQKEMLEVKNTVTEMKNTFGGLRVELTLSQ